LEIPNFFYFFPFGPKKIRSKNTRVKDGLASYLLLVKSILGLGQGPSLPDTPVLMKPQQALTGRPEQNNKS